MNAFISQILTDCFETVAPRAIDRYTDSPRVRGIYAAVVESFPDASFTPLWRVVEDDRVAVGGVSRGTHLGPWRDVPPTGLAFEVLATMMLEVSDGRIVDLTVVTDSFAMAEQLGVVEPLGPKACERLTKTPCGDALFAPH